MLAFLTIKFTSNLNKCFDVTLTIFDMVPDNEVEATNLKIEIQQRSEDAKKWIDSVVASLNQSINDELKQNRQVAKEVFLKLYKMEKDLNEPFSNFEEAIRKIDLCQMSLKYG